CNDVFPAFTSDPTCEEANPDEQATAVLGFFILVCSKQVPLHLPFIAGVIPAKVSIGSAAALSVKDVQEIPPVCNLPGHFPEVLHVCGDGIHTDQKRVTSSSCLRNSLSSSTKAPSFSLVDSPAERV